MPILKFTIITLFREALEPYLNSSMLFKAQKKGLVEYNFVNLRDFGIGPHKSVDDTPYGGGDGMLMRCEPVFAAVESIKSRDPSAKVIIPTPGGRLWTQTFAKELLSSQDDVPLFSRTADSSGSVSGYSASKGCLPPPAADDPKNAESPSGDFSSGGSCRRIFTENKFFRGDNAASEQVLSGPSRSAQRERERRGPYAAGAADACPDETCSEKQLEITPKHFVIFCPHYEGYDYRINTLADYQISLGEYILTGGELPALIIIDTLTRLVPGVLGGATSAEIESFSDGDLLEYPQYTKPADFRGLKVPEILLSGNHGAIDDWRKQHSNHFDPEEFQNGRFSDHRAARSASVSAAAPTPRAPRTRVAKTSNSEIPARKKRFDA